MGWLSLFDTSVFDLSKWTDGNIYNDHADVLIMAPTNFQSCVYCAIVNARQGGLITENQKNVMTAAVSDRMIMSLIYTLAAGLSLHPNSVQEIIKSDDVATLFGDKLKEIAGSFTILQEDTVHAIANDLVAFAHSCIPEPVNPARRKKTTKRIKSHITRAISISCQHQEEAPGRFQEWMRQVTKEMQSHQQSPPPLPLSELPQLQLP